MNSCWHTITHSCIDDGMHRCCCACMLASMEENDEIRDWLQHWGFGFTTSVPDRVGMLWSKKRLGEVVRCVAVGLCHRKCVASPLDHRPFFERHYRAFSQASFTWVTNLTESCYFEGVTCHHPSEHIGLAELNLIQLTLNSGFKTASMVKKIFRHCLMFYLSFSMRSSSRKD